MAHPCRRPILISMVFVISTAVPFELRGAPPPETPTSLPGVTVINAQKAWDLMQQGAVVVDARVAHEYVEERIKGAISIPYKEHSQKRVDFDPSQDQFDLSKLPANKSAAVIFYCNAGQCWKSYKASKAAVTAGYRNIYWLRGGIPEWKDQQFPVE
ncbi:MAG: rhodanese-like domain-containing protein [Candidatus Manganitrophaceae bacterium]